MTEPGLVLRVAALGDGLTADGRHVALAAPGDVLLPDGTLRHGPNHVEPPCIHFPQCGGCQLQHLSDAAYTEFVAARVAGALMGQGVVPGLLAEPHISPPEARRRATLKAVRGGKGITIGFAQSGSHQIVDMHMCVLLHPALFGLVAPLRKLLAVQGVMGKAATIVMTLADQGVDLMLEGVTAEGLAATERLIDFAGTQRLARLILDEGEGSTMTLWEPEPVTVTFGGLPVALPPGAFLQATADGEAALVAEVVAAVGDAPTVADLFAGVGTFALSLARGRKVYAAEASRDALAALKSGGDRLPGRVFVEHRDLFRRPLVPAELNRFGAVVIDPPRAGAREQVIHLAAATVPVIAYVSCNPSSFSRDAATLIEAGYVLDRVRPVGQFRWSSHVELVGTFRRPS
ncbi:MAG: class I SAM-dependent RNA methyltransferase [Sphingobium sp.]